MIRSRYPRFLSTLARFALAVLSSFVFIASASAGDTREAVKGYWASEDSIFLVYEEHDQLHTKVITLLFDVYDVSEGAEREGQPRRDDNNPDDIERNRLIEGMSFISDYTFKSNKWQGKVYDPKNGKTFKSQMSLASDGRLKMRGYIGSPLFGQTVLFDAANSCQSHIVDLLQKPKNAELCIQLCPTDCP